MISGFMHSNLWLECQRFDLISANLFNVRLPDEDEFRITSLADDFLDVLTHNLPFMNAQHD